MKNCLKKFGIGLVMLMVSVGVMAQDQKHVAIKINPLSLFLLTGNAKVEVAFHKNLSIQLGGYYGSLKTRLGAPAGVETGMRYAVGAIIPELRIYPLANNAAPEGFYFAPFFRYRRTMIGVSANVYDPDLLGEILADVKYTANSYGGGIITGYQFISDGGFVADAYLGFVGSGARNQIGITCEECDGDEDIGFKFRFGTGNFGFRMGVGLGYAF